MSSGKLEKLPFRAFVVAKSAALENNTRHLIKFIIISAYIFLNRVVKRLEKLAFAAFVGTILVVLKNSNNHVRN